MRRIIGLLSKNFSPTQLPGLAVWLDAKDSAGFTLGSGRVSQWRDKSGKGNHAAQATGGQQPLYVASAVNGNPAVQFYDDGSAKLLSIADHASLDCAAFSLFVVCQRVQDMGATERIAGKFSTSSPANTREFSMLLSSGDVYQCATSSAGTVADGAAGTSGTVSLSAPVILDALISQPYASGTASRARKNNDAASQAVSSIPGLYNGTSPFHLGAIDGGAQPFAGYIGEIIFYTVALSEASRAKVLRYLAKRWGVSVAS